MKIGFDAKRALFNHSGLGNYSRNLILSLKKSFPENSYFLYTPKTKGAYENQFDKSAFESVSPRFFAFKLIPSLWRRFTIATVAKSNDIDVYHGLSHELPIGIERTGIKTIVTIHDLIFERFPHHYSYFDVIGYRKKIKHACKIADAIVAISEQTKSDLIEFYQVEESKISVIYQGCDDSFSNATDLKLATLVSKKFQLPNEYILHVGAFTERKNQLKLLEAFFLIKDKISANIVLVGKGGSEEAKIKQFITNNKLNDRALFISEINNVELSYVFKKAKLLVYNSLFEGFGIPILEAFVSEIPVITSTGSCFEEVGGDACIYINANDEVALSKSIFSVLTDNILKDELVKKAKNRLSLFNNQTIASEYMKVYSSVYLKK